MGKFKCMVMVMVIHSALVRSHQSTSAGGESEVESAGTVLAAPPPVRRAWGGRVALRRASRTPHFWQASQ